MHRSLLRLHRYVGLALAGFLVVIGLTGSVTAFFPDLDPWLNPELMTVEPRGERLDTLDVLLRLQAQDPDAHIFSVHYPKGPRGTVSAYAEPAIDPKTGSEASIAYDQVFADPYTGDRVGSRLWGDWPLERKNVFTFLYFLHYSLVLPEFLGEVFMGIVALIWAGDCIVGFLLTLPRPAHGARRGTGFWTRWRPAWTIHMHGGVNRFVFDWHRAAGLWLWLVLLMVAVSGFSFNLPSVYAAVMSRLTSYADTEVHPALPEPLLSPAIGWREAETLGRRYISEQAAARGFSVVRPYGLTYRREKGIYVYRVVSSRDLTIYGDTSVSLDATTGRLVTVTVSTGDNVGNTFTSWIKALHQATVFGLPYRIFVSVLGIVTAGLAVTGVVLWNRKRRSRARRRVQAASDVAAGNLVSR